MTGLTPTGYILTSIFVGLAFGVFLQKSRFCFVSAFRDFVGFKDTRVLKGVLAGVFVLTIFWSVQATFGFFRGFWTPAWGLGSFIGGLVFGLGMTLAGGCASGTLYRAGQGYIQFWIVLLFMFVGYILFAFVFPVFEVHYFERLNPFEGTTAYLHFPWSPAVTGILAVALGIIVYAYVIGRSVLPEDPGGGTPAGTPVNSGVLPPARSFAAVELGGRRIAGETRNHVLAWFTDDRPIRRRLRDPWDARTAGIGMAIVAAVWFWVHGHWAITGAEAQWAGWTLAQLGMDVENVRYWGTILFHDTAITITVDMLMIAALMVGSFLAAWFSGDFRIRTPNRNRLPNYVVGGFLMGIGSRLAAGCNIANLFSGIALLSVHSVLAGLGILVGVYIMTHWLYREVGCAL